MRYTVHPSVSLSDRIYRILLFVYPSDFRAEYGHQMSQVFRDRCRDRVRSSGWTGLALLWAATLADLSESAVREHLALLSQDLRYGARMLTRRPGFAAVAIFTLVAGIGANTTIFSIINSVLLKPLPYADPGRIVTLWERNFKEPAGRDEVSPPNFLDWRERARTVEAMASINPWSLEYLSDGEPEVFLTGLVSEGFFEILGVRPLHGRTFAPDEFESGKGQVCVLSFRLWQRRFGSDASTIGRKLVLNNRPFTIVGVMPPEFGLIDPQKEIWAPQFFDNAMRQQRRATYLKVIARLAPSASIRDAAGEMEAISAALAAEYPQSSQDIGADVVPLADHMVGNVRLALLTLFGAVGLVLLIACANVANLLLARAAERQREFAIRIALGAGQSRLARQLLTEGALLAALGCGGGILLAHWGSKVVASLAPAAIPRIQEAALDGSVLALAVAMGGATALVFGLAPSFQFSGREVQGSLKESSKNSTAGKRHERIRSALVVSEIALALVLLIGAGLLVQSFARLVRVDPGFAPDRVVTLQVFTWRRQAKPEQRAAYIQESVARLETLPGVLAAGAASALPLVTAGHAFAMPVTAEGQPAPAAGQEPLCFATITAAGYFEAIGIPILAGRGFSEFDRSDSHPVAVINDVMARRHWPNENPIGKRFTAGTAWRITYEVVGIAGAVRNAGLASQTRPEYFTAHSQDPSGSMIFVVRTSQDPIHLLPAIKNRIWEVNKAQPFYQIATMEELLAATLEERRFSLLLLSCMAALALVLATVGIYGVISFSISQRTHEIGVRIALGATSFNIARMILRQGGILTAKGIAIGIAASLLLTRFIESLLFEVETTDLSTFAAISALVGLVSIFACFLPARRASRTDPITAVRFD